MRRARASALDRREPRRQVFLLFRLLRLLLRDGLLALRRRRHLLQRLSRHFQQDLVHLRV